MITCSHEAAARIATAMSRIREIQRSRHGELLDFKAPSDGLYTLELHDLLSRGGEEYFYRLTMSTRWRHPDVPFPERYVRLALLAYEKDRLSLGRLAEFLETSIGEVYALIEESELGETAAAHSLGDPGTCGTKHHDLSAHDPARGARQRTREMISRVSRDAD